VKKKLVILGGGESGVGTAILGAKQGWDVFLSDASAIASRYKAVLNESNISFEENKHSEEIILEAQVVMKSPGIPETADIVKKIRAKGIQVVSEIEFAFWYKGDSIIVAVTGTNGKTTTTSLIYHMMKNADLSVSLGGNIGSSFALSVAEEATDYYVLELSSFQLDDIEKFRPDISVLLNITPDHLDRYNYRIEDYVQSKFNLIKNQREEDYFVYNADDIEITSYLNNHSFDVVKLPFSTQSSASTTGWVADEQINIEYKTNNYTMNIADLGLRGIHNTQNSMAAAIVGNVLDIRKETIRESLMNFESIEHRLEFVAKVGGVKYLNDSKATNVNSTWYALESVEKPLVWIAGGVDKGNDYSQLTDLVKERVRIIVCLGEDNRKIHEAFRKDVDMIINTSSAREAVLAASKFAKKGETVLLSPACASFDLFDNYEDRGRQFKEAVRNL
jgi:UDP-N-acetylmuramoylalanine--D-glutamate ligase